MEGLGKNGGLIIDTVAEEKKKTERGTALNRPQINVFLYYDMNDIIMYMQRILLCFAGTPPQVPMPRQRIDYHVNAFSHEDNLTNPIRVFAPRTQRWKKRTKGRASAYISSAAGSLRRPSA